MSFKNIPLDTKIGRGKPNASSAFEIESTTKGFLKPRMTTAQRLALTPVEGLEVFDTDLGLPFVYGNGTWGSFAGIPAAGTSTDNAIVRWDGVSGSILQDSVVTISDVGDMSALNSVQAGNILISGNTIESVDTDGDITITPDGTGKVVISGDLQVDGTTTTVNSTTLEVADANILVNKDGNQATADGNDAGLTVSMSDATDAIVHYDSTATSKWKVGEVGSTVEVATISNSQVLTNKRLSNGASVDANLDLQIESTTAASKPWPTMTEAQRDALTPVDGAVIKNSDTDAIEIYSTAEAAWVPVGSGSGGLAQWVSGEEYTALESVVWLVADDKIYRCITTNTDVSFTPANWVELSSDSAVETLINGHIADATDAHDASAISYNNATSSLVATEVQAAIDEVEGRLDTAETDITDNATVISDHITDTVDAHDASAISSTNPLGANVEAVLTALNNHKDSGLQGAYDEFRQITLSSGNHIKVLNDSSDTNTFLTTFTNHDESVAHFGIGKDKTLIGKEIQFNNVSTGAKISHTTRENITVTDTMGTELLRKQTNILYIQDFKDTFPIAYFTEAASMTKVNEADTSYASNTVARINQTGAVALEYVDSEPIVLTGADWYLEPIKLKVMQSKTGAGTWFMYLMTSTDGVTYTASQSSIEVGDKKNDKFITQLASDVTHIKVRWVIGVADNATILRIGRVLINAKAFEVGQTTVEQKIERTSGVNPISGGLNSPAWISGYTLDFSSNTSESGAKILSRVNVSGYTVFTATKKCKVDFNFILASSSAGNQIRIYDYTSQTLLSSGTTVQGGAEFMDSPPTIALESGQSFIVTATNYANNVNTYSEINATAYADNVIVDAATSGLNTQEYNPTLQGFGTPSVKYGASQIVGNSLIIQGKITSGTTSGVEARYYLPSGYTILDGTPIKIFAVTDRNVATASEQLFVIGEGNQGYLKFGKKTGSLTALTAVTDTELLASGNTVSFTAIVPVNELDMSSQLISLNVSSERRNDYGFLFTGGTLTSYRGGVAISATNPSTGRFTINYTSLGLTQAPDLNAIPQNVDNNTTSVTYANVTATSADIYFSRVDAYFNPTSFRLQIYRMGSDDRPPQAFIAGSVALTEANTAGIEYRTNEKVDGKWVYARTWKTLVNIPSGTTTVATVETNLEVLTSLRVAPNVYVLPNGSYFASDTDISYVKYDSSAGVVSVVNVNRTVYAGTYITIKYLK